MSDAKSWLIGVFIYFAVFIIIISSVSTFTNESFDADQYNSSTDQANFDIVTADHICTDPRFEYDPLTGEGERYSRARRDHLECDESRGVLGQDNCDNIEGCTWGVVDSSSWYFWQTSNSSGCNGYINASFYGVNMTADNTRVALHSYSGFWSGAYLSTTDPSPCNHVSVAFNKNNCAIFSCSWQPFDFAEEMKTPTSIISTISQVFTLRYNFGMSGDMAFVFNLVFVILPIIILILSIYLLAHPFKN